MGKLHIEQVLEHLLGMVQFGPGQDKVAFFCHVSLGRLLTKSSTSQ
jgi:hypothetical protein